MARLVLATALLAVLLASCGGDGGEPTPTAPEPSATAPGASLPLRPDQQDVYVVNADGSGLRKLFEEGDYLDALPSPDGRWLAVSVAEWDVEVSTALVIDLDSGERQQVAQVAGGISLNDWSPDGQSLAMTTYPVTSPPESRVLIFRAPSGELGEVALPKASFLAWAADSASLYLVSDDDPDVLYTAKPPHFEPEEVLPGLTFDDAALSADGATLALGTYAPRSPSYYTIELVRTDGSERRQLVRLDDIFVSGGLAWSPDGTRLAYSQVIAGDGSADSGIFVAEVATGEVTRLSDAPDGVDIRGEWSPDGQSVLVHRHVCTQCDGPGSKVALARADGSGEVALPGTESFQFTDSEWSPDGARFAYSADALYVASADGSDVEELLRLPGASYRALAWSDDGGRLFFVHAPALPDTAYAVAPDGSGLEPLGAGVSSVAPDGGTVAGYDDHTLYIRSGEDEPVRVAGPELEQIGIGPETFPQLLRWSPDGRWLLIGQGTKGGAGLAIASRQGELRVVVGSPWEGEPRWSPDGQRIAYWSAGALWGTGIAGGEPQRLASVETAPGIDWSPDGERLAVYDGTDVRAVATDGTSAAPELLFPLALQQYSGNLLRWSPDGEHIAVTTGRDLAIGAIGSGSMVEVPVGAAVDLPGLEWTSDGTTLAFALGYGSAEHTPGVYVVDAEGGAPLQVVEAIGRAYDVLGVLDDGRIVFVSRFTL